MVRQTLGVIVLSAIALLLARVEPQQHASSSLVPEQTVGADAFVDSIGINVHLHNGNTIYGSFPVIYAALRDLGIRHTRDGLINTTLEDYYKRHAQLAAIGIRCLFITGPEDSDATLLRFSQRVAGAVEGLEAPNEYDRTGGGNWPSTLAAFMPRLRIMAHELSESGQIAVVGPALTSAESYTKLPPALQADFDFINMHNYFGGWNPGTAGWGDNGYGSISWNLDLVEKVWGSKPTYTTETGYLTDSTVGQSIDEQLQAIYVPRIFLEQQLHGVRRTYLYELADEGPAIPKAERSFGLLREDGSRKPAFVALQRLIAALTDPGTAFIPRTIDYELRSPPASLHHIFFQKRKGLFYLAFWLEEPSFDQRSRQPLPCPPINFALHVANTIHTTRLLSVDPREAASIPRVADTKEVSLTATSTVHMLEFRLASPEHSPQKP